MIAYLGPAVGRLAEIESHDAARRRRSTPRPRAAADRSRRGRGRRGGPARRAAPLAAAVEANLGQLAMASARFEVAVGEHDPGDDVTFLLAANPGADPGPLAKVASGGELARSMLALRLVLSVAPPILVFDEVDAGIGGQAGAGGRPVAGRAGADHQVLVVTHLPAGGGLRRCPGRASARQVDDGDHRARPPRRSTTTSRVVELSRMLSGTPDSERVREAADELLELAAAGARHDEGRLPLVSWASPMLARGDTQSLGAVLAIRSHHTVPDRRWWVDDRHTTTRRARHRRRPSTTRRNGPDGRSSPGRRSPGIARVDTRTKDLAKRLQPGEIAVIDHDRPRHGGGREPPRRRGGRRGQRRRLHLRPVPQPGPAAARRPPASPSSTASATTS